MVKNSFIIIVIIINMMWMLILCKEDIKDTEDLFMI